MSPPTSPSQCLEEIQCINHKWSEPQKETCHNPDHQEYYTTGFHWYVHCPNCFRIKEVSVQ